MDAAYPCRVAEIQHDHPTDLKHISIMHRLDIRYILISSPMLSGSVIQLCGNKYVAAGSIRLPGALSFNSPATMTKPVTTIC